MRLGDAIQGGADGAAFAAEHVAVHAGRDGVLPEDFLAAFGVAGGDGFVVGLGLRDEFAELQVVEIAVALGRRGSSLMLALGLLPLL